MNSGSYAMEPVSQDGALVTIALVIVAVLAVLTVIMMVVGARKRAARKAAEAQEQDRIADLEARGVEATNTAEGTGGVIAPPPATSPAPAARPAPAPAPPPATIAEEPPVPAPMADEPIAAAAPLDASPASVAADAPAAAPTGDAGPVGQLKGLGPKIQARLAELGITRVDQLAWLDDAEAEALDAQLGPFQGRMARDRWREQARLLAQGDRAGFEAQFGKLG